MLFAEAADKRINAASIFKPAFLLLLLQDNVVFSLSKRGRNTDLQTSLSQTGDAQVGGRFFFFFLVIFFSCMETQKCFPPDMKGLHKGCCSDMQQRGVVWEEDELIHVI